MAEQSGQEKSEAPSERKREKSREDGQVVFSKELSSALLLGAATLVFMFTAPSILASMERMFIGVLSNVALTEDLAPTMLYALLQDRLNPIFFSMLPFAVIIILTGIMAAVLQVGINFTPKPIAPKFSKLNPASGIKRLFSTQGLTDLLKSLTKLFIVGSIGYTSFQQEINHINGLSLTSVRSIVDYNFGVVAAISGKIVVALLVLSTFDYLYQRWHHEQQIKMTKQELKEESKQSEGDPHLKSRIRQIQREMSSARMMQEVPKADAIIVNPTHYAIAVLYDREVMDAPQVIAKGVDFLALRMKTIAGEHNVPILERKELARALYASVEVGENIPEEFYKAIAAILAHVYRLKK